MLGFSSPLVGELFFGKGVFMSDYQGDTKIFSLDDLQNGDTKVFQAKADLNNENPEKKLPEESSEAKKKKVKKKKIIAVFLLLLLGATGFFYYRHRNKADLFDPFSLVEISVEGADGYASLIVKEKDVVSEDEAEILNRIEFIYPKKENLSNKDEVLIEVDVKDEKWFEEAKIKLDPMEKKVLINELDETENIAWQKAVEIDYSMRNDQVIVKDLRLNLDEIPEKARPIFEEAFLDVSAKEDLKIGDEIRVSLKLSARNKKALGKIAYRIDSEEARMTVEEFIYVPRYLSDIPELDRLVEEKYEELVSELEKEGAENIRLKSVCYNDDMDAALLKIYQREGYDADNGTLLLLIQYQLDHEEGEPINLSKVAGYTNLKAKNKKLYKDPSPIEFFYEETDIDRISKHLTEDGFECDAR